MEGVSNRMKRSAWVLPVLGILLLVAGTAGAVDSTDEQIGVMWNRTLANGSAEFHVRYDGINGDPGADVGESELKENAVSLCRTNTSAPTGEECWNEDRRVWEPMENDSVNPTIMTFTSFDPEGCDSTSGDNWTCSDSIRLPPYTNEPLRVTVTAQIGHGSLQADTFLESSRTFTLKQDETEPSFGTHDHGFSTLSEAETNDVLLYMAVFFMSVTQGWIMPALGSTASILGLFMGASVFASFTFGAIFILLMFWVEWAAKNFIAHGGR